MNILLTNDDGYASAGFRAAFDAMCRFGKVFAVAPKAECSACSHTLTLRKPIAVEMLSHEHYGTVYAIDGTPADCVRLGITVLLDAKIDLVVSGINHGANTGVDVFYSGTVAAAREAAIIGHRAIALSQALRRPIETSWDKVRDAAATVVEQIIGEELPGPGFWSINFPAPTPDEPHRHVHRVPIAVQPTPMAFDKLEAEDGRTSYGYGAPYWSREVSEHSDYTVVRDGGIAVSAIPLYGKF
jgi:5'-nucleotidase